ncbi:MAG: Hsp20/alpha crystallin family protein [Desulfobacterales bacterium]|nr:Hsp20/alpha crystallin family protein [Desulfobacterales bacterium]MDJ0912733.1 Hsp20/alpha crystallin family protein [Desulfobacterales bacterium]
MDYIKIRFGDDSDPFSSRFEQTVEEMFRSLNPRFTLCERAWNPPMDICETPDDIIIRAEIAGVDKEDLGVEINRKAVRIYGHRRAMTRLENSTYRLAEIQYGQFERVLFLPAPIDTEIVSSAYSNGFLEIRLGKLKLDEVHRIPISDE